MLLSAISCGQQHKAESVIKEFMKDNLMENHKPSDLTFNKIDSTEYITDSLVENMRKNAELSGRYKSNIEYAPKRAGEKLIISRVEYILEKEKYSDTYYLNKDLTHVISVKTN